MVATLYPSRRRVPALPYVGSVGLRRRSLREVRRSYNLRPCSAAASVALGRGRREPTSCGACAALVGGGRGTLPPSAAVSTPPRTPLRLIGRPLRGAAGVGCRFGYRGRRVCFLGCRWLDSFRAARGFYTCGVFVSGVSGVRNALHALT